MNRAAGWVFLLPVNGILNGSNPGRFRRSGGNIVVRVVVEVTVEFARVTELSAARRTEDLALCLLLLPTVERVLVAHVVVQRAVVRERGGAHAADVRLLAEVAVDVLVQAVLDLEDVAAEPTLVAVEAVLRLVVDLLEVGHDGRGRR